MDGRTPDDQRLPGTHAFVDHPSEIVLRVRAETLADLADEAAEALASLMASTTHETGERYQTEFTVEGTDRGALLINLLNEIVSRAETDHFVPTKTESQLTGPSRLAVRVSGDKVREAPSRVKAATFHNLTVSDRNGFIEAVVTFDV